MGVGIAVVLLAIIGASVGVAWYVFKKRHAPHGLPDEAAFQETNYKNPMFGDLGEGGANVGAFTTITSQGSKASGCSYQSIPDMDAANERGQPPAPLFTKSGKVKGDAGKAAGVVVIDVAAQLTHLRDARPIYLTHTTHRAHDAGQVVVGVAAPQRWKGKKASADKAGGKGRPVSIHEVLRGSSMHEGEHVQYAVPLADDAEPGASYLDIRDAGDGAGSMTSMSSTGSDTSDYQRLQSHSQYIETPLLPHPAGDDDGLYDSSPMPPLAPGIDRALKEDAMAVTYGGWELQQRQGRAGTTGSMVDYASVDDADTHGYEDADGIDGLLSVARGNLQRQQQSAPGDVIYQSSPSVSQGDGGDMHDVTQAAVNPRDVYSVPQRTRGGNTNTKNTKRKTSAKPVTHNLT